MKPYGGPAFAGRTRVFNGMVSQYVDGRPSEWHHDIVDHPGMSLRDYIAARVLPAIVASGYPSGLIEAGYGRSWFAREAYAYADTMIAEREKSTNQGSPQ